MFVQIAIAGVIALAFAAADEEPWTRSQEMTPEALASVLRDPGAPQPAIFETSFPVLYRNRHIPGAVFAGPGARQAGLDMLKKAVEKLSRSREVVIYCGCCPMKQCPNIRPAFRLLQEMGFTNTKVLVIPTNLAKDWIDKGYPIERLQ
jgi:thiosulfate/3-mercaptopyruvate sulfurtransferase